MANLVAAGVWARKLSRKRYDRILKVDHKKFREELPSRVGVRHDYYEAHKTTIKKKAKWYRTNRGKLWRRRTMKAWRLANRQKLNEYLRHHPCVDCGEADIVVLEFDHVRGKKRVSISCVIGSFRWESVLKEITKCDVRCANCHRRKTAKERRYFRYVGR